jgi:hypothetical protein
MPQARRPNAHAERTHLHPLRRRPTLPRGGSGPCPRGPAPAPRIGRLIEAPWLANSGHGASITVSARARHLGDERRDRLLVHGDQPLPAGTTNPDANTRPPRQRSRSVSKAPPGVASPIIRSERISAARLSQMTQERRVHGGRADHEVRGSGVFVHQQQLGAHLQPQRRERSE